MTNQPSKVKIGNDSENGSSWRWWVLLTVIFGTFLGRLDQTIVNLAVPKIIDDFSITVTQAGWISTAYILANAVFVPVWGKLGDTLGRKKVYLWGFSIFIFGSMLAGLAWNLGSMLVFRVIQAIAVSADYPTAMAILSVTFKKGREQAQALGIWSSAFAASTVLGPLIGGPLIDNFGWRSIFLINLPLGLVGIFLALAFIHESRSERKTVSFDWFGSITLGIALSALVLVLDQGVIWGWLSWQSLLSYATVAVFSYWFYFIESRHPEPVVDFKFFKNNVFNSTLLNNFIIFMGMIGSIFLVPLFAQTFLGFNATESGYLFIPMAAGLMIAAPLGGRLTGRSDTRVVIFASTAVAAIGLYLMSFLDARSSAWDIMIPLAVMAFGMGFGMSQRTATIAAVVPEEEIGIASSVLALVRNIAGAFGIAVFSTVLNSAIENSAISLTHNSIINTASPEAMKQAIALIMLKAQISGYAYVFFLSALIVFIGSFSALFIKVSRDKQIHEVIIIE
ncbi:multidrug efflux MFS transporter [Patescibacteria group bacterium]|nr:multidrug efflux MFS transporter [Patescibacteria group bacterium]